MALKEENMLSLADLYFRDETGKYRFQWSNKAYTDGVVEPSYDDDNEYYQRLSKYNYLREHLNDGSNAAVNYKITVIDEDDNIVASQIVNGFEAAISLESGEYFWQVEALDANGNIITASEEAYINTGYNDWGNDPFISHKDSSADHTVGELGSYWEHWDGQGIRLSWAGQISSGENKADFIVCGPAQCGNEEAWEIATEDLEVIFSPSNAFGGFTGEFALTGNCLTTCGGIYEYENGKWNYKAFTEPWLYCFESNQCSKDYLITDGGPSGNKLYKWDTAQDKLVEVLTASSTIYYISDKYYNTADGVYSIENNSRVLEYEIKYGECPLYNDLFFNIYAVDADGNKKEDLAAGENGSIVVKYFFFDEKNDKIIEKEETLFSGTATMTYDAGEIFEVRVGNCICFVLQDEGDEITNPSVQVVVHEIMKDGSINEHTYTCTSYDDFDFSVDSNGKLFCEYGESVIDFDIVVNNDILFTGNTNSLGPFLSCGEEGLVWEGDPTNVQCIGISNQAGGRLTYLVEEGVSELKFYGIASGNYEFSYALEDQGNAQSAFWTIQAESSIKRHVGTSEGKANIFFGGGLQKWSAAFEAEHTGFINGWGGTHKKVSLAGKNKIADMFMAGTDENILVLTDDANGDALFVDDIYTALPESVTKPEARIAHIDEIRAGAGDDIIDMTSQKFAYAGDEMTIRGGDGNDVIWAAGGDNDLFGDAGDDHIIGSAGFDVIAGGTGNDTLHSGGGNDVFAFCENWGVDTVEITDNAYITLWFVSGKKGNWDRTNRIYRDGSNSVTVIGGKNSTIDLKFGNAGGDYEDMVDSGAFEASTSQKIFETSSGMLA